MQLCYISDSYIINLNSKEILVEDISVEAKEENNDEVFSINGEFGFLSLNSFSLTTFSIPNPIIISSPTSSVRIRHHYPTPLPAFSPYGSFEGDEDL